MIKHLVRLAATTIWALTLLLAATQYSSGQAVVSNENNPFLDPKGLQPLDIGAIVQGGFGAYLGCGSPQGCPDASLRLSIRQGNMSFSSQAARKSKGTAKRSGPWKRVSDSTET